MCGFVAFLTSQTVDADTQNIICPLPGWAWELLGPLLEGTWGIVLRGGLLSLTSHARAPPCPVGGEGTAMATWGTTPGSAKRKALT